MKDYLPLFALLFLACNSFSQVTGKVTDTEGNPLSSVNIYVEDSYNGTTSNQSGNYALEMKQTGKTTIVFQYLGFKTLQKKVTIEKFPFVLNAVLKEESNSLDEVVINSGENPANRIIRKAIANRKKNLAKIKAYTADFYSRGTWTVKNAPEKILGQEVDYDDSMVLDSTRSGIIYLSETTSKIKYKAPNDFHETILASKVSGNDNGFSLNSARESNFSLYNNTIKINTDLVSPIADFAFNYYSYKLTNAFYDDKGNLINKIKVIPKRPKDRVFSGYIYIIENLWEIYGIELKTTGASTQIPPIETMNFNQSFKYSKEDKLWVKISQVVDFTWKIFGISGTGKFTGVYSNYDFSPNFAKDSFTNEVMSFAENANKKDSIFWEKARPIPLTIEEANDYVKKDSIQKVHKSKPYLDSIDRVRNKFSLSDILLGYHYANSSKNYDFDISSPLFGTRFNTVQGWNTNLRASFTKAQKKREKFYQIYSDMSYGFSDDRFRISGGFLKKFNNFSKPYLRIEGGIKAEEINNTNPIPSLVNTVANVFFERNYLKLYDKLYAEASYSQEFFNGFRFYSTLGFERRSALFNTTDQVIVSDKYGGYTSNNPLQPQNFGSAPFETHNIAKLNLTARINFGQDYYSYPDGKYNAVNTDYPTVYLGYEKGFASTVGDYNFDQIKIMATQELDLKNKGDLSYSLKAGKFFHGEHMSLVDYKHFNGNQTRIGTSSSYLNKYNLLPYYAFSTNDQYAEAHLEHNFQGWVLGKIPYVNQLNFNLVIGGHALWTGDRKPYQEYSIGLDNLGFGSFRFFRIDYVESFYNGGHQGAFIFGLQFLNVLGN